MKNNKKVLSSVVVGLLFCWLIIPAVLYLLISAPFEKRKYRASRYFADTGCNFSLGITSSPEYRFYNQAVVDGLDFRYFPGDEEHRDWFIYNNTAYVFPDFDAIAQDDETGKWQIYSEDEWSDFYDYFSGVESAIPDKGEMSVRVMVTHDMIQSPEDDLPDAVYAVGSYETAFADTTK